MRRLRPYSRASPHPRVLRATGIALHRWGPRVLQTRIARSSTFSQGISLRLRGTDLAGNDKDARAGLIWRTIRSGGLDAHHALASEQASSQHGIGFAAPEGRTS